MADQYCNVCHAPWDRYGVSHGDMNAAEATMFLQGRGCPSCEGIRDDDQPDDDGLQSLRSAADSWDGDPLAAIMTILDNEGRPYDLSEVKPVTIIACQGCGEEFTLTPSDFSLAEWQRLVKATDVASCLKSMGRALSDDEVCSNSRASHSSDDYHTINGMSWCPNCCTTCDHCGEALFVDGDDYVTRQEGYNVEQFHLDCYCEVLSEEHFSYAQEECERVLSRFDLDLIDGASMDLADIESDLGWYDGSNDPDDDKIRDWLIEANTDTLIHEDYGGPWTSEQWRSLLGLIDEDMEALDDLALVTTEWSGGRYVWVVQQNDATIFHGSKAECYAEATRVNREMI